MEKVHYCFEFICATVLVLQMSKTVKKQEKEAKMWRSRWEASNQSVMKMTEEVSTSPRHCFVNHCFSQRAGHEKVVIDLKGRIEKLEKLCRALQKERNDLRSQIREQEVCSVRICVLV